MELSTIALCIAGVLMQLILLVGKRLECQDWVGVVGAAGVVTTIRSRLATGHTTAV